MTAQNIVDDSPGIARVTFRVRCESLGYGEAVFLHPNNKSSRPIPLYTTARKYPWFTSRSPAAIPVQKDDETATYSYRYAVFRAGVFHRWEDPSDGPSDDGNVKMDVENEGTIATHKVPLKLLTVGEEYTINDVLGVTFGHPNIDHIRVPHNSGYEEMTMLHSTHRIDSFQKVKSGTSLSTSIHRVSSIPDTKKKKVGFAPEPPSYQGTDGHGGGSSAGMKREPVHLDSTDGLIVASAFLPVHLHRSPEGEWSADWDYEALLSMQTHLRVTRIGVVKWRGWHGNFGQQTCNKKSPQEGGVPVDERHKVEECLRQFNCVPVWVEPLLFGEMYNGFCKGVLWPVLHNVTSVYSSRPDGGGDKEVNDTASFQTTKSHSKSGDMNVEETLSNVSDRFTQYQMDDVAMGTIHGDGGKEASLWAAYTAVNRKFVEIIVQCFNEGDLVWIHGFHLLVLPSFLTRRLPMAKIGLFLHTPFPSSEIFRTLWCREDLLRGMLNADQVGFHLFEYARHFLTCSRRLLGLKYGMIPDEAGGHNLAIEMNGRHVAVTSIHAGIEPPILSQVLTHQSTVDRAVSIRNQFKGKVIFCAIDRMESLKGIPLKMLGLERFLNMCPEWVGKIVLIQVGISAFERGDDYVRTKKETLAMVAKINKIWPGTVQFQECSEAEMRLPQRIALMRASDVIMVTPIRDGLNLIPLEFTAVHQDALTEEGRSDGRRRGICILSEFSSSTRVMRGALHVNPWKISELANSFHQALNMSIDERMRRLNTASEFVSRVTTERWAMAVLLDLKAVQKSADVGMYSGAGLGLGYRILGMNRGFESLDASAVSKAYKKARGRLIFLDYGGTILSNDNLDAFSRFQVATKSRKYTVPTSAMISTLKDLCSDKRNIVFVVSGKERHSLTETLNDIPNLGLAAEHGMFISWPTQNTGQKRMWDSLVPDTDRSWRSIAITIMEVYSSRTHGSYIEETEMKVLWQYRDADPEFGYLQARELEDHLSNVLRSFSVDILHGGVEEGGYVEVRPKGVNKGVVATHILKNVPKMSTWEKVDFLFALGDDHCDEPMLSVMRQVGRRAIDARRARNHESPLPPLPASVALVDVSSCDNYVSPSIATFTCTVGKKPSAAANYLNDVDEVQEFLDTLVKVSTRNDRFYSAVNLRELDNNAVISPFIRPNTTTIAPATQGGMFSNNRSLNAGSRSMSMGNFHVASDFRKSEPAKVSANLSEFLGTMEDDDDDEDGIFI
uniref:CBM20 domain-containing protein n=1 Tax=Chaetoceros debilis TaxID=122233 RepID=A0A7S3Q2V3_9STRA|mmetsp:Transcript_19919/g.30142  ORF Transcript_19919/g.30142 Transcript_19919/m.30142 type:complete len:1233 (+) Transcript_19919:316-4014(+)|eukprot:CAMPEP_0194077404 /NCGR_PEP_ID=MMETSP0149-20130528/4033_1 /TAXON_ID=122233 /ORGANISM="Chaetoceros debilis, Strain MM31A-1" /LENGTH=1232 /DNA_ID=CAMNT_0038758413 /DNA_START=192 /DNA_END=3890 /DNA_ORIENTATION=-